MKKIIFVAIALFTLALAFTSCEEKNSTSGHVSYYSAPAAVR